MLFRSIDVDGIRDSILDEDHSDNKKYEFNFINPKDDLTFQEAKDLFERTFIETALSTNLGKINQTALKANIPKKTLLRKIEKYSINPKDYYKK